MAPPCLSNYQVLTTPSSTSYSLILGRPPSISDSYCDAQDPSNVELDDIIPGKPIVSKPLSEPTSATFLILRKRFAKITGKITHHFQQLHEPAKYEDVQALDKELRQFVDDLPPVSQDPITAPCLDVH